MHSFSVCWLLRVVCRLCLWCHFHSLIHTSENEVQEIKHKPRHAHGVCHALGHEVMYGNRVRSSAVDILSLSVDGVQIHGQQWLGSLLQGMCTCRHQNRQSDYISSFNPHCRKRGKYEFFFLFLLLRYNWQAALCKFMVYSITTWLTYIAKTITIISLVNVPHCI